MDELEFKGLMEQYIANNAEKVLDMREITDPTGFKIMGYDALGNALIGAQHVGGGSGGTSGDYVLNGGSATTMKDVDDLFDKILATRGDAGEEYVNLIPNVNQGDIFDKNSVFLNPGYKLTSSTHNMYVRTAEIPFVAPRRVALAVNVHFDSVPDSYVFNMGFHKAGMLGISPEWTADNFGLTNFTGTSRTFVYIWTQSQAANPIIYLYKWETGAGHTIELTVKDIAVLDMGVDATNPLFNMTSGELETMFRDSSVLGAVISTGTNAVVKTAQEVINVAPAVIRSANKYSGKRLVTIGDSLTAGSPYQNILAGHTGMRWDIVANNSGVGYVNDTAGTYKPTVDGLTPSGAGEWTDGTGTWRKAYETAKGGTFVKPNDISSIYIRAFDVPHYNPDIIIIYGGQNDQLPWKSAGNSATTPSEIVAAETAYKTKAPSGSVSTLAAYKGMIENLMEKKPNAIIYLVTQPRVYAEIGKDVGGSIRFPDMAAVLAWENTERLPKVELIRALGKYYSLPVIDLWDNSGISDFNASSWYGATSGDATQVHPNNAGNMRIAEVMLSTI